MKGHHQHLLSLLLVLILCSIFLLSHGHSLSDSKKYSRKILLESHILDTEALSDSDFTNAKDEESLRQFHVHVKHPVPTWLRAKLEKEYSVTKPTYVPHNTFALVSTLKKIKKAREALKDQIVWVGEVKPDYKISSDLEDELDGIDSDTYETFDDHHVVAKPLTKKQQKTKALEVLILPAFDRTSKNVADSWQSSMKNIGYDVDVSPLSDTKILVSVKKDFVNQVVEWIAQNQFANHIQAKEDFAVLNDDMLTDEPLILADMDPLSDEYKALAMATAAAAKPEKEWVGQPALPDVKYLWSLGLDGEGEVIGIGDTGLDYDNCFFHDPNGTVPFNKVADTHRKIKAYWTLADNKDVVRGHGSHINSIAAGNSAEQPMFNGVIPKAKINFIDIGRPDFHLQLPPDLSTDYFPLIHKATSISSNSWGNKRYGQYTLAAREIDDYTYKNKDFLVLYAAGNSGRSGGATITPPGTAKNALTVGAAQGTYRGYEVGLPLYADLIKRQMTSQFCSSETLADSDAFCSAVGAPAPCSDSANALCGQIKTAQDCCKMPFLAKFCCPKVMLENLKTNPHHFNPDNAAVFSSRGPTKDNRLKPEIVAHGQPVFGARSEGTPGKYHCPIPLVMQGTSQATPIVAATAVQAKQYFKKGFYPSGKPNPKDAFDPSGVLLKATLINSGSNLPGWVDLNGQDVNWAKLKPIPSFTQGFGRVRLTNGLPFAGRSNFTYFKEEQSVSTGDKVEICFRVDANPSKEFKTTLVWMDPPASPVAKITLVNNLDLLVSDANGKVYHGNGGIDYINNVEQVFIKPEKASGKEYKVTVYGTNIPQGPQSFALVATGNMKKIDCSSVKFSDITYPSQPAKAKATKSKGGLEELFGFLADNAFGL